MFAGVDLLIAVGAIIMILGFLGCCGAVRESRCMLMLVGKKKHLSTFNKPQLHMMDRVLASSIK